MLSSPNPQIFPSIRPTRALSRTSSISFSSFAPFTSCTIAQSLPAFSTASKHSPHTNARNSIPFMLLLHASLYTRGMGSSLNPNVFSDPAPLPIQLALVARRFANSFRSNTYATRRNR